jgi:hypothetical protein
MYRVEHPVFATAESSFLDGGSRLDDVDLGPLITFSGERSVNAPNTTILGSQPTSLAARRWLIPEACSG